MNIIETQSLTKAYGRRRVVNGVSLRVRTTDPARTLALLQDAMPNLALSAEPDGSLLAGGISDSNAIAHLLHDADQVILELTVQQRDIEEYFLSLMEGGERHV